MAQMKQVPSLDVITGLRIKGIFRENGEYVIIFEYQTRKYQKIYRLIAGKTGLRFELDSCKRIPKN